MERRVGEAASERSTRVMRKWYVLGVGMKDGELLGKGAVGARVGIDV